MIQTAESATSKLDVTLQTERHKTVIDQISTKDVWANMVFAYGWAWELGSPFTSAQVESYLKAMKPKLATFLSSSRIGLVPLITKVVSANWVASPYGALAMCTYSDFIGWDHYVTESDTHGAINYANENPEYKQVHEEMMPASGKVGTQVWYAEFGSHAPGSTPPTHCISYFSPEILKFGLTCGGYNDCGLLMIWTMWSDTAYGHAAFNPDGTPKDWYITVTPYFPKIS